MKQCIVICMLAAVPLLYAQAFNDHVFLEDGILDYSLEKNRAASRGEVDRLRSMIEGKIKLRDRTVSVVLDRNKQCKNICIIADLTGSMSPHTADLIIWLKLNMLKRGSKNFVFFNDGDRTPDSKKKIGSTGGIYAAQAETYEQAAGLAVKTMRAGYGGDGPENDIEAVCKAVELYGAVCDEFVLVADNMSDMRDISLLKKVKKPVRVILCGTGVRVNIQYLELARATGGSVHTIGQDITELMKLHEGKTIRIGTETFIIRGGRFERMAGA